MLTFVGAGGKICLVLERQGSEHEEKRPLRQRRVFGNKNKKAVDKREKMGEINLAVAKQQRTLKTEQYVKP